MSKNFEILPTYVYLGYILTHVGKPIPPFYLGNDDKFTVTAKVSNFHEYTICCQRELLAQKITIVLPDFDSNPNECLRQMKNFHEKLNETTGFNLNCIFIEKEDVDHMDWRPGLLLPGIEQV